MGNEDHFGNSTKVVPKPGLWLWSSDLLQLQASTKECIHDYILHRISVYITYGDINTCIQIWLTPLTWVPHKGSKALNVIWYDSRGGKIWYLAGHFHLHLGKNADQTS
jgi:hypothetical protein